MRSPPLSQDHPNLGNPRESRHRERSGVAEVASRWVDGVRIEPIDRVAAVLPVVDDTVAPDRERVRSRCAIRWSLGWTAGTPST